MILRTLIVSYVHHQIMERITGTVAGVSNYYCKQAAAVKFCDTWCKWRKESKQFYFLFAKLHQTSLPEVFLLFSLPARSARKKERKKSSREPMSL